MFVGGLSASTTIDDVKAYFEQYGKVGNDSGLNLLEARIPFAGSRNG